MKIIRPGGTVSVAPGEQFAVEWKSRGSSGVSTKSDFPAAIVKVHSDVKPANRMGGGNLINDVFRCTRRGKFVIRYEASRPWEDEKNVSEVVVSCD